MGIETGISWADSTFNPWLGCVEVSPACDHCYARTLVSGRMGRDVWGKDKPRTRTSENYWKQPLKWNAAAQKSGKRHTVFCGSLCDVMEDRYDLGPIRADLFELIEQTPSLTWLLLTKRPQNLRRLLPFALPPNIWALTTVESPEYFWRIDTLKGCGVPILGLSIEPLLADMPTLGEYLDGISWVLVGGESGAKDSRPMHPNWARNIRDACLLREIPFHFKQWGDWAPHAGKAFYKGPIPEYRAANEDGLVRLGKKVAGHLLDGQEWLQFPVAR